MFLFLLWEQEDTEADLAAVTDGTVIAVCTKVVGRRISPPEEIRTREEKQRRNSGVCLGVCFSRQSTTSFKSVTGSDARFPSKVRQIDVIDLCYVLICNQEVAGSIPVRSIHLRKAGVCSGVCFAPHHAPFRSTTRP
jgi:hypothetical protein